MPLTELLDPDQQPDFDVLVELQAYLRGLLDDADETLEAFYIPKSGGFAHRIDTFKHKDAPTLSKASTATCVALLHATGRLGDKPWGLERSELIRAIVESDWSSAKLDPDNPFTVSFLLEALDQLGGEAALPEGGMAIVTEKLGRLIAHVLDEDDGDSDRRGGVALQEYEATAFLTYKAVSALRRWDRLGDVREDVERWNWNHLYKESVLVASDSADADVFEVAYSTLIATAVAELDEMTPQQRSLLTFGLEQFFKAQRPDGMWPRSRPLFVYRELGHAYCYDYELLAALLSEPQLRTTLSDRLGKLHLAAQALDARKYPLKTTAAALIAAAEEQAVDRPETAAVDAPAVAVTEPTQAASADDAVAAEGVQDADQTEATAGAPRQPPYGWSSGHHGTYAAAESWATAAALHFSFALGQLVAERIRQETFDYVGADYTQPLPRAGSPMLPEKFLDSVLVDGPPPKMLKERLQSRMLEPLIAVREHLKHGKKLPKKVTDEPGGLRVPTSAILFGPPGTSKSELAKLIAKALGWPLLALDPSHLTRRGLDGVHAEANRLFGMLQRCDQVVVLLDEFDELVREREGPTDMQSRFLTTAMLPKLTALYKARRIVYLVATNHVEQFDAAIRRPGRFDLIVPVLPPTWAEKERNWTKLAEGIAALEADAREKARADLADLIFLEADDLAEEYAGDPDADVGALVAKFAESCTMRQPVDPHRATATADARAEVKGDEKDTDDGAKDQSAESWKSRMAREAPERIRGL